MDSNLFNDLVSSLQEAKQIARGQMPASRRFQLDDLDVRHLRERTGLSQSEFASLLRVSVKTPQNWEQRRRTPTGAASALLTIVSKNPAMALRALHG